MYRIFIILILSVLTNAFAFIDNNNFYHGYDAAGNRTTTRQDQDLSRYGYDANNRLSTVVSGGGSINLGYDRSHLLVSIAYPNGTKSERSYDTSGRLSRIKHSQRNAVVFNETLYRYDANGNRLEEERRLGQNSELWSYQYDRDDRLIEERSPSLTVGYGYDAAGNRISERATGSSSYEKTYQHNQRHQITRIENGAQSIDFSYDACGNLMSC